MTATIDSLVRSHAADDGERTFAWFDPTDAPAVAITYRELNAHVDRTGRMLNRLGIGAGARFHVHLTNCLEFYYLWFGAARVGAVMVPTNPLSTPEELAYIVEHADCAVSVSQPDLVDNVLAARRLTGSCGKVLHTGDEDIQGARRLHDELVAPASRIDHEPQPDDLVSVLYTSGTTSRPKGVLVTNSAYVHAGEVVARHVHLQPHDRNLIVLPLFHGNAQYYSTMSALVTGASIILADRFSASRFGAQAAEFGATVASLFAAPIRMILAHDTGVTVSSLRLRVTLFAQTVGDDQVAEFEDRFGCPLVQLYGMTETVAPPLINPVAADRRAAAMGRPVHGARIRVADERGEDLPPGEIGELLIGGELGTTLMAGYLDNPEATAKAFRGGWLHTGDNVTLDPDGFVYFVDRGSDMIKRSGENVSTVEVERVVNEHPAVFESAVVGVPDDIRDEAVKAFVVLHTGHRADAAEVIQWCSERLAKYKVPSYVVFVDTLPRTSVGKIQKRLLAAG